MDLFGDLPEPETKNNKPETTLSRSTSITEKNPPGQALRPSKSGLNPSQAVWRGVRGNYVSVTQGTGGGGLFDDLPPNSSELPANASGLSSSNSDLSSNAGQKDDTQHVEYGEGDRGKKRKIDESQDGALPENDTRGTCAQERTNAEAGSKKLIGGMYMLKGFVADRKGEREDMQDAHYLTEDLLPEIGVVDSSITRVAYFAVFDGHGGDRASKYAATHLHKNIACKFPKGDIAQVEKDIKRQLIEAFKKTNDDFLKLATARKPSWKDGTTAVAVLVINNTLYIANLGDSKAILCRYSEEKKSYMAVPLTKDHNPTQYEERMRIQKAGGNVKDGRVMGILEVSRSLGDGPYKAHGVTCIPDVKRCQLTNNDRYILIACDGLWKTFKSEESVLFVNRILELHASSDAANSKSKERLHSDFETACGRVANEAVRKLSADNVTVMLVSIQNPS
ncbi:integrin-linked kinase-associated serine/threonine phosphatase 2C [Lingula anatina]|uniref:Integrin-linked kinase-associated serine/threonine phosphatase 2C n=1 Tax=Lingula anatina TaxID=7574 RepID=A0A1S3II30_LINAN|nr:integrin-linked kinase-associated serine/threonine phosphatase 2C [Lingula anatina]|eukprot:XP_013397895.1 integrin-linked kinase-associated serine/threonine phosphatase 2C [Lingula anatina]